MLRHNYREVVFVFLAFTLMAAAAYFSVGQILRGRLLDRAEEMIYTAEANVRAGFSEAETILLNASIFVQSMIEQGASKQEILDYLISTTQWMRQRDKGLLKYYGIFGYIYGDFLDSAGLNPGNDFIPQTRPWYQTAVRSGIVVGYTTPYIDWRTNDTIVSAVQNIFDNDGRIIGILAIDVEISWLTEYINSLKMASGGYGILVNQNMTIMSHPNHAYIGFQLQDLGSSYNEIARTLLRGDDLFARKATDSIYRSTIVFFTRIFNSWYVGIVTPYHQFYKDLYTSAAILIILGLVLSLLLSYMLLSISAAKMRADEENKYKTSFLARMSHEIRTPMNAITGMAELLLRGELSKEARSYAEDIKHAGTNLISIINDILDISKIEAGKLEIIPSKYSFSSMINDIINIIRMRLAEKPIQFSANIDENIPDSLIGDQVKFQQIFLNILSNAAKYTAQGYIDLVVKAEKRVDKQIWLKITVRDTGKGIKPEDQVKLFGDFIQLEANKNLGIEGTGLGLAITKRLCLAMGGDISVESKYGKGSTFTVIIPQGIESEVKFALANDQEKNSDSSGMVNFTTPHARFLIVDDIITNLKVAEGLLLPYLATIDTSQSGAKAIELIKKHEYDLVFMDHMMPEMDGVETTRLIREWEKEQENNTKTRKQANEKNLDFQHRRQIPIVALTANAVSGMREMFIEKGFSDFLAKPIDVPKFDEIIERWIPKEKKQQIVNDETETNSANIPNPKDLK